MFVLWVTVKRSEMSFKYDFPFTKTVHAFSATHAQIQLSLVCQLLHYVHCSTIQRWHARSVCSVRASEHESKCEVSVNWKASKVKSVCALYCACHRRHSHQCILTSKTYTPLNFTDTLPVSELHYLDWLKHLNKVNISTKSNRLIGAAWIIFCDFLVKNILIKTVKHLPWIELRTFKCECVWSREDALLVMLASEFEW